MPYYDEPASETSTPRRKRYWENADFWKDAGERIVTVFLFGALSATTIDNITNAQLSWQQIILAGGIMSVLSSVKAFIGANMNTASPTGWTGNPPTN
jgi:hypothetical protein